MIITKEILELFYACDEQLDLFSYQFPDGIDISDLWTRNRDEFIKNSLSQLIIRRNIGWLISEGMIPIQSLALIGQDLSGLNMSGASLQDSLFKECQLNRSNWGGSTVKYSFFENCEMVSVNCYSAFFINCSFRRCNLNNTNFSRAIFIDCLFEKIDFTNILTDNTRIIDPIFRYCKNQPRANKGFVMSRYSATVSACVVKQAFAGVDVTLLLQDEDVCLFFGYDYPLARYVLDVEDADDYHEFGYGGRGFVPGKRLTKGQMLDVLHEIVNQASSEELAQFLNAIVMDLPV